MFQLNHIPRIGSSLRRTSVVFLIFLIVISIAVLPISAQEVKQKAFGSPEEAIKALVETMQAGDKKGVLAILGPEGEDIIDSGDAVQDKNAQDRFVKSYQERVDYVKEKEDLFQFRL
jgi:hypothetical protein